MTHLGGGCRWGTFVESDNWSTAGTRQHCSADFSAAPEKKNQNSRSKIRQIDAKGMNNIFKLEVLGPQLQVGGPSGLLDFVLSQLPN